MTTKLAHTPGPWDYTRDNSDTMQGWRVIDPDSDNGDCIALVDPDDIATDLGYSTEATARLLAAAPALLAQLTNLIDAAELVVERWESGDLADAVNGLRVDAATAKEAIEKAVQP